MSSPNRSGKCVAPGGEAVVLRDAGHELATSIKRATAHPAKWYGTANNAYTAQKVAAISNPIIRRLTETVAGRGEAGWRVHDPVGVNTPGYKVNLRL